jgi:hypothetical protein
MPVVARASPWLAAGDDHDPGVDTRRRRERAARDRRPGPHVEGGAPPPSTRGIRIGPPSCGLLLDDEVRAEEAAVRLQETSEQRRRHPERGVRHHVERSTGQAQVGGVGLDQDHRVAEAAPQVTGAFGVGLDGDDPHARIEERGGDDAAAGADVEHEIARAKVGTGDEPGRPLRTELVPPPRPP